MLQDVTGETGKKTSPCQRRMSLLYQKPESQDHWLHECNLGHCERYVRPYLLISTDTYRYLERSRPYSVNLVQVWTHSNVSIKACTNMDGQLFSPANLAGRTWLIQSWSHHYDQCHYDQCHYRQYFSLWQCKVTHERKLLPAIPSRPKDGCEQTIGTPQTTSHEGVFLKFPQSSVPDVSFLKCYQKGHIYALH